MIQLTPTEEQIAQFESVKTTRKCQYMVLTLNEGNNAFEVLKMGEKGAPYEELMEHFPKDDCRYVITDFEYTTNENPPRKTSKLILFLWCPSTAKITRKFPFASANGPLKNAFTGIQKEIQVITYI